MLIVETPRLLIATGRRVLEALTSQWAATLSEIREEKLVYLFTARPNNCELYSQSILFRFPSRQDLSTNCGDRCIVFLVASDKKGHPGFVRYTLNVKQP